ncbi:MAG: helix-turn-helix domain-containing protein [Planctomycetota bacterium]
MQLIVDQDAIRQIAKPIVAEVVAAVGSTGQAERLAYPESEAAQLLGIAAHQLRDARLRGEITATKAGGRIAYERDELIAYLARGRQD